MKKTITTALSLFLATLLSAQTTRLQSMVDSLRYLTTNTLDCSAGLYWRIIAQGDKAIPFLIDKLTDTTPTMVKYHCKKTSLNVGEVAYFALDEIAYFPTFLVTKMQFDLITIDETGQECWSFYDFFFINANKLRYQRSVWEWYNKEQPRYKAKKIPAKEQTKCQKQYGINTYFNWTE